MSKILKSLWKILLWALLVVLLIIRWTTAYKQWFVTDQKIETEFTKYFDEVSVSRIDIQWKSIRYLDVWPKDWKIVVMIHGAPWSFYEQRWIVSDPKFSQGYRFILFDRLGYAGSQIGKSVKSIKEHSDSTMGLLKKIWITKDANPLIVWHSYGATIALKMAMDYSEEIAWAVVVSGAVDPDHETVFAISHLIKRQPLKFLSWPMFWVANDEKLAHVDSLRNEVQNYEDISIPVQVIHGTADSIVPYENFEYMKKNIPTERWDFVSLEGKDHALHMSDPEVFVKAITEFSF